MANFTFDPVHLGHVHLVVSRFPRERFSHHTCAGGTVNINSLPAKSNLSK
jgi:hypothetical protein